MRPLPILRHWTALLAVPLALWSALPTVRWCSAGWNEVRVACFLPCVAGNAAGECSVETPASCGSKSACATPSTDCDAGECGATGTEAGSSESSTACAEGAEFPCGLAFCLDGPTGGDGIPADSRAPLSEPPSVSAAIALALPGVPTAPARGTWDFNDADEFPASPTRARFHQARAPPASV